MKYHNRNIIAMCELFPILAQLGTYYTIYYLYNKTSPLHIFAYLYGTLVFCREKFVQFLVTKLRVGILCKKRVYVRHLYRRELVGRRVFSTPQSPLNIISQCVFLKSRLVYIIIDCLAKYNLKKKLNLFPYIYCTRYITFLL